MILVTTSLALYALAQAVDSNKLVTHSDGLHGYISFEHEPLPKAGKFSAGMGFYAAVWELTDEPLADFQIGLPSCWIIPDNEDNKDRPLAPVGTLARRWKERGPTWSSVFQTIEGGLGYWAGNNFRYGPPKFSMNATPQCYDYEIGSPGWSFFYGDAALPDNRLGIAQLSNRMLIPPDGLPFKGRPNGEFLGYSWMALPFTEPVNGDVPTGDQSWTCFLTAANFKGPIAYYIPETWSKIGKLFNEPFLHGRGLDARAGIMGGGAMEINTVPRIEGQDKQGNIYSKLPRLKFRQTLRVRPGSFKMSPTILGQHSMNRSRLGVKAIQSATENLTFRTLSSLNSVRRRQNTLKAAMHWLQSKLHLIRRSLRVTSGDSSGKKVAQPNGVTSLSISRKLTSGE